jgi:class 3 adenylate cyclase
VTLIGRLRRTILTRLFASVSVVVLLALGALAWRQIAGERSALMNATRENAQQDANLVVTSIAYSMLQGEGIAVKTLVDGIVKTVPEAEVKIYDPHGGPVFGAPPPAPPAASLPPLLASVLADGQRRVTETGLVFRAISNEQRCWRCHAQADGIRGVLSLKPVDSTITKDRERIVAEVVHAGFVHVMTARQSDRLDDYFGELEKTTSLVAVGVYNRKGRLKFGSRLPDLPDEALRRALTPGAKAETIGEPSSRITLVPLPMEERCSQCHKDKGPVRGALAIAFRPLEGDGAACRELEAVVDTSLRTIMMSSLGRMITYFLRTVAQTGAVESIAVFDSVGRLYFDSRPVAAPAYVQATLATGVPGVTIVGTGPGERILVTQPLRNEARCVRCHGPDSTVRGVVTVSLSTGAAATARDRALKLAGVVSILALALALVVLYLLLKQLVVRPVAEIEGTAREIGNGNLDVSVRHAHSEGDELKRLGSQINKMVHGLRTKIVLERFVSRGAAEAAHGAARGKQRELTGNGVRRLMSVLFSDVRGFTAYSESVPAETVVEMLNRMLEAQAEVVEANGGDIDKYVGDQLMAVFTGGGAVERAVTCAVELVEAVERARRPGETLAIGAGVMTGEVIYGPIGSRSRMDFTVIGDVVNVGARLCSAAAPGQVLVGAAVHEACGETPGIVFEELLPIAGKGKREPLRVFAARRA